jgi:dihydroorotase
VYDLILRDGRILDPANGRDGTGDVAFRDGQVVAVGGRIQGDSRATVDVAGRIVAPGLIDLHAHVYNLGTSLGVDADDVARSSGATTLVDAGSAGAGIFAGFRRHVIERGRTRVVAFLNISHPGIFGFGPPINVGECQDLRLVHAGECVRVAREHRDLIVGVKVRIGDNTSDGIRPLEVALEAANALGLPLMTHIGKPPPSIGAVVRLLRPGDILTHCCRPAPNTPVLEDGAVCEEYRAARQRGVLFDVGHGGGSFGFRTARALIEAGFLPDTISSDVHRGSIDGPAYNLLVTMSKFLNLGVGVADILRMSTAAPAAAIGRTALGHLGVGAVGDATVLDVQAGRFSFTDVVGETVSGDRQFAVVARVVAGRLVEDDVRMAAS